MKIVLNVLRDSVHLLPANDDSVVKKVDDDVGRKKAKLMI